MNKNPEILIVDDVPNAAEDFAELISAKYKFGILTTDNPLEAINIIKSNPIKVVVLDQKMPQMKGTDLFKKLIEINPLIKAVMLSAEAERQEVGDAYELGYESFLEKTKIRELPDKVFKLYTKFEIDFQKQFQIKDFPVILSERKGLFTESTIDFHLLGVQKINENFLFEDKWMTTVEVLAGQNIEYEEELSLEESITINEDISHKLKTEFNLSEKKLDLLKLKINGEINRKFAITSVDKKFLKKKRKVNYSLPEQPVEINKVYIVKRTFEINPVFIEFRGIICKNCSLCNNFQPVPIVFYKQSKKIATRQQNILSDSKKETIDTGTNLYF